MDAFTDYILQFFGYEKKKFKIKKKKIKKNS